MRMYLFSFKILRTNYYFSYFNFQLHRANYFTNIIIRNFLPLYFEFHRI
jgi:hypothetical protein